MIKLEVLLHTVTVMRAHQWPNVSAAFDVACGRCSKAPSLFLRSLSTALGQKRPTADATQGKSKGDKKGGVLATATSLCSHRFVTAQHAAGKRISTALGKAAGIKICHAHCFSEAETHSVWTGAAQLQPNDKRLARVGDNCSVHVPGTDRVASPTLKHPQMMLMMLPTWANIIEGPFLLLQASTFLHNPTETVSTRPGAATHPPSACGGCGFGSLKVFRQTLFVSTGHGQPTQARTHEAELRRHCQHHQGMRAVDVKPRWLTQEIHPQNMNPTFDISPVLHIMVCMKSEKRVCHV